MKKKSDIWSTKKVYRTELYAYIILAAMIVLAIGSMVHFFIIPSNERMEALHNDYSRRQKSLDSLCRQTETIYLDSVHRKCTLDTLLENKVLSLERQQSDMLADIRQENNNHIEYVNSWLGVWIAILALGCGVAPAVIQYRLYIVNRHRLREELEEFEIVTSNHEISNYISSMSQCLESSVVLDSTVSRRIIQHLVRKSVYCFEQITETITKAYPESQPPRIQSNSLVALILMSSVLDKLKTRVSSRNIRQINECTDLISRKIQGAVSDKSADRENISQAMSSVLRKIQEIPVIWDFDDSSS